MKIRVLGAHNAEARRERLTSLLVDDALALDAGGLTSSLSLKAQGRIKAVLITHHHFDHTRDLLTLGMNAARQGSTFDIYALSETLSILESCLLDGRIYVNFAQLTSEEKPAMRFHPVQPSRAESILQYLVTALPARHPVPSIGYYVVAPGGESLFYTGDTGPGIHECWEHMSPKLLFTEVSGTNDNVDLMNKVGHLCADTLRDELLAIRKLKGYLPKIIVIHLTPQIESRIRDEVSRVAADLGADITVAHEGMIVTI